MRRKTIIAVILCVASMPVCAGGLLTNSNQNAAFLRSMAQDGTIDINSIYANPAGGAFLSEGWHLALNMQSAFQQRNITTTYFPYFSQNVNTPSDTHEYKGKATAPVVPSFTLSYNRPRWSVSVHFALGGGGGKCEFDDGLGSFEAAYAPLLLSVANGYALDSYMKGRSYYYDIQVGGTYKFLSNLSGFVGLRGVIPTCNYRGYVYPTVYFTEAMSMPLSTYDTELNCDQSGFGVTPIIGIDWKISGRWNVAAKYEVPTKLNLKNSTTMSADPLVVVSAGELLSQFEDGEKVREDVPGILTLGAQYTPIEKVRISAGFHEYFDKKAKKYGDKQKLIDHNTWELNAAVEWDICKFVTVSASWQTTQYGLSDEYMNDLSFNLPNNMVGAGVRIHPCKILSIDLGYMHTIYSSRDVVSENTEELRLINHYERRNDVIGIGLNFDF